MPTNKKAAKPAKKGVQVKKSSSAKKPAGKSSAPAKSARPAPKKAVKVPVKKLPVKKAVTKPAPQRMQKIVAVKPVVALKPIKEPEVKKPVMPKKEEKKPDTKKTEVKSPEPIAAAPLPKKPAPPVKPSKVVIPEMLTKTVRKYEPEFTKSVLDQPVHISEGPTMRYSDGELQEFRELIGKKLEQAKKELTYLQGLITRKDEMGGDENENRYMTMEDGSMSMEREQLAQMASRQINYIDHLEKAIMRIENRTYGICRVTGKLIDKARLRAVPHATLSIEAKQMMNK